MASSVSVEQVGRESTKAFGVSCGATFVCSHGALLFVLDTVRTWTWQPVGGLLPLQGWRSPQRLISLGVLEVCDRDNGTSSGPARVRQNIGCEGLAKKISERGQRHDGDS